MDTAYVDRRAIIEEMAARRPDVAVISAVTGEGVEAARILMASQLTAAHRVQRIHLGYEQGEAMAWLHARGEVLADEPEGEGHVLTVRLDPADRARFARLWPTGAPPHIGSAPGRERQREALSIVLGAVTQQKTLTN